MKRKIQKNCTRLGSDLSYVDFVQTSSGVFRIGSAPEISKWLVKYHLKYDYVIMPEPHVTTMGDNYTGEEFIIWNQIHFHNSEPVRYIGYLKDLMYLTKRLHLTIDQKFNKTQTRIEPVLRIPKLCHLMPLAGSEIHIGKTNIVFSGNNIEIFDNNSLVYSYMNLSPHKNVAFETENLIAPFLKNLEPSENLKIFVLGNGNGFKYKTSNFLVRFGERVIWIDVGAYPFQLLAKHKFHPDIVTDYIITHNHEDHWEGFTAILQRAVETHSIINLLTTQKIFNTLKKQIGFLFPDFDQIVKLERLTPNEPLPYFKSVITARLNHHPLRQGVLGLKFEFNEICFGISGDTLYNEQLIEKLKREELTYKFFKKCDLLFHEVEFKNPNTVHSYYKEVEKLSKKIKGKLFVYHTHIRKKLLPLAKEGYWYSIEKNKIKITK